MNPEYSLWDAVMGSSIGLTMRTTIEVRNLFYNLPQRRVSKTEDKKTILRLTQALALHHCQRIEFRLFLDNASEFSTAGGQTQMDIMALISKQSTSQFRSGEIKSEEYDCHITGVYSILSAIKSKRELFLFVNERYNYTEQGRLVECDRIRKAVDKVYSILHSAVYDEIGGYYVYLSIRLNPKHVDANVTLSCQSRSIPTKKRFDLSTSLRYLS